MKPAHPFATSLTCTLLWKCPLVILNHPPCFLQSYCCSVYSISLFTQNLSSYLVVNAYALNKFNRLLQPVD